MPQQVIIQTMEGKVIALEKASGRQIWAYSQSVPALTLRGSSSPLVVGDQVLAGFADGKLVSLDYQTGKLRWSTTIAVPAGPVRKVTVTSLILCGQN